jgi:hypothetical protein
VIHKEFICYYSPFFAVGFNGNFEEGRTQMMKLSDVDPALFAIVVNWIYNKVVRDDKEEKPDVLTCAKIWILGYRFLIGGGDCRTKKPSRSISILLRRLNASRATLTLLDLVDFAE